MYARLTTTSLILYCYVRLLNNDVSQLNNDVSQLNNDIVQLNNDIVQLNCDVSDLYNDVFLLNNEPDQDFKMLALRLVWQGCFGIAIHIKIYGLLCTIF